jgi:hypothetical protein
MGGSSLRSEKPAEARPALVPAHGKGVLRPFQPGQSGNPGGKGGLYHEAQRICREASSAAARRVAKLMNSADERVALLAAEKVLERACGKPKETPEKAIVDPKQDEERQALRIELIRRYCQRIVAEVHEVMALGDRLQPGLAAGDGSRRRLLGTLLAEALMPDRDAMPERREAAAHA